MPRQFSGTPTLAELFKQADDYSASMEDANLKTKLQTQAEAQQMARMNQEAALKATAEETKRNTTKQDLEGYLNKYPKTAVKVGDYSVNPENEMNLLAISERRDRQDDRDLVKLGERISKANIPVTMSAFANLENTTNKDGQGGFLTNKSYKVKSTGPVANTIRSIPGGQMALNIGERMGLMPEGAGEETALVQRLMNQDIRNMSGTAVTAYEQGRQNVEKGMTGAGDPNLIKLGVKQMQDAISSEANTIESSTRESVVDTFRKQDGKINLQEYLGGKQPQTPQSAQPQMLRVKEKATGQTGTIPANEYNANEYEIVK